MGPMDVALGVACLGMGPMGLMAFRWAGSEGCMMLAGCLAPLSMPCRLHLQPLPWTLMP